MRCEYCHNQLPDDSHFCPFCGRAVSSSQKNTSALPTHTVDPVSETVFCRRCGKPVDENTKRCLGCGRQYFRGVPPLVFLCVVLALAVVGLMIVCVTQELRYHARIDELEQLLDLCKARII